MASGYKYNVKRTGKLLSKYGERLRNIQKQVNLARDATNMFSAGLLNFAKIQISSTISVGTSRAFHSKDGLGVDLMRLHKELDRKFLNSPEIDKIMLDILQEAQELAPIDKRYVGKVDFSEKGFKLKTVPSFSSLKSRQEGLLYSSDNKGERTRSTVYGRAMTEASEKRVPRRSFNFPNESFSVEKQIQMRKFLSGSNREDRRKLWFNSSNEGMQLSGGSINLYKIRKTDKASRNTILATKFTDNEKHGGEEELRRSGKYDRDEKTISFDPTRLGASFNYAPIQHDNLSFKHILGKEALFLYTPYKKREKELVDVIKEEVEKEIDRMQRDKTIKYSVRDLKEISAPIKMVNKITVDRSKSNLSKLLREYKKLTK